MSTVGFLLGLLFKLGDDEALEVVKLGLRAAAQKSCGMCRAEFGVCKEPDVPHWIHISRDRRGNHTFKCSASEIQDILSELEIYQRR